MKTIIPPWAGKHGRFTLLFEAFAIEVLQACRNVKAAAAILGLSWDSFCDSLQTIMNRKVARMLKQHLPNLLSSFLYRITNAAREGFNSVIQSLKYAAHGFRSFTNYRTRILFFCGTQDLKPQLRCR